MKQIMIVASVFLATAFAFAQEKALDIRPSAPADKALDVRPSAPADKALDVRLSAPADKALDIRPAETTEKALTGVEWEYTNDVALVRATSDAVLAAFVSDEAVAKTLLAQMKGAYLTDPLAARQIAAVTQWVMLPDAWYCLWWDGEHAAGRKVWVKALLATAEGSADSYVKTFCLDQLRWCGCDCPCVIKRIRTIGATGDKAVKDFAEVVVRELTGQAIGL